MEDSISTEQGPTQILREALEVFKNLPTDDEDQEYNWAYLLFIAGSVGVTAFVIHKAIMKLYEHAYEYITRRRVLGLPRDGWRYGFYERVERFLKERYPGLSGASGIVVQDQINASITQEWASQRTGNNTTYSVARPRIWLDNGDSSEGELVEECDRHQTQDVDESDPVSSTPISKESSGSSKLRTATEGASCIESPVESERPKKDFVLRVDRSLDLAGGPIYIPGLRYPIWADNSRLDPEKGGLETSTKKQAPLSVRFKSEADLSDGSLYQTAVHEASRVNESSALSISNDFFEFVGDKKKREEKKIQGEKKKGNIK